MTNSLAAARRCLDGRARSARHRPAGTGLRNEARPGGDSCAGGCGSRGPARGQQGEAEAGAAAEAYADRAFPASEVTMAEIQGAIKADAKLQGKGPKLFSKWDSIGPDTLDVDRLGTQSFIKPTQWSGRVTALTVDPKCEAQECTLYVGAAGGGVWQTKNALAKKAALEADLGGIPTNAIGSIAVDPNDPTGKTLYVGTGEANNSGDSEAGLGLYKSTDDGKHWSLVPGSFAVANNRSIAWVAVEPGNANHILFGTRSGTHGDGSNSTSVQPPRPSPPLGVYNSTDGGATFTLTQAGSVNEVKFDPGNPSTVYARRRRPSACSARRRAARPEPGRRSSRSTAAVSRSRRSRCRTARRASTSPTRAAEGRARRCTASTTRASRRRR